MIIFYIIFGMGLATMIPRFIPAFIVNSFVFRDWMNRWLQSIPYAALGALIFPAILLVKGGAPHIGIIGGLVGVALAYFGLNIVLVVIGSILAVFLMTI